jgi:hypothetical protein
MECGVHAHEAAYLELLAGAGVDELVALLDGALVDAHVGKLAVLAVLQLEGQGYGRQFVSLGAPSTELLVVVEVQGDVLYLGRVGQEVDNAVQEELDALVLVGGADENGHELLGDGALAHCARIISGVSVPSR